MFWEVVCISCLFVALSVQYSNMHMQFLAGNEKDHLKVTLLRIDSSLQGVLSCLPDFSPSPRDGTVKDPGFMPFLIAGATGAKVGSTVLREKAAEVMHAACR